jgi:hypothetical protein
MLYREITGYKYMLEKAFIFRLPKDCRKFGPSSPHRFIRVDAAGWVTVYKGYGWNGASGPTFDSKSTMVPCLMHDVCYDLIANGCLPRSCREPIDQKMRRDLVAWGMNRVRAWYWYWGVRIGGFNHGKDPDLKQSAVKELI